VIGLRNVPDELDGIGKQAGGKRADANPTLICRAAVYAGMLPRFAHRGVGAKGGQPVNSGRIGMRCQSTQDAVSGPTLMPRVMSL